MSLFSDIANAIGHTVDSLAQAVGTDISILETVVNDLDGNGIDVFSAAAKLGLSAEGFLRGIVDLLNSDPHQLLLQRLTGRIKPMQDPLYQLSQHWMQVANLHQSTAQTLDTHINELFQGSGTESYSGPAADSLWATHQNYQQHFTVLVEHAQTQQVRHATLEGHMSDYLSQMPGKVYSLSTPMAALGVLSFDTAAFVVPSPPSSPSSLIDPQFIQGTENTIQTMEQEDESYPPGPEDPIWDFFTICIIVLAIFVGIMIVINWAWNGLSQFFGWQKSTTPPTNSKKVNPPTNNGLTPAQQNLHNDVASRLAGTTYDSREIDDLIRAGYLDPDVIAAIIRGGSGTFAAFDDPTIAKTMNALDPSVQSVIVAQAIANNYSKVQVEAILESITKTKSVAASENENFTYANSSQTVTAHTIQEHVGKTDDYLKERVSKGPSQGGAKFASTFPDEATAQSGVDMVIAKSAKLQALIKAAVPGTAATDKNCNPPVVYGHGFQKNVTSQGPPPTYGDPTQYDNLHCVTVTIGIGPSGEPFIITAYPST